jgi:protein-S-isoprenylcysteine O-methyltransferase Ste14
MSDLPRPPRVPPLAVAGILFVAMWAIARVAPSFAFDFGGRRLASLQLLLLAAAIGLAGTRSFRRARTTVNPLQPDRASALVTTGIYRYTRNPMYVAVALALLAWSVYLGHALALLGAVAFVAWMDRRQIPAEEHALRGLFGADFERYCAEVRRWL